MRCGKTKANAGNPKAGIRWMEEERCSAQKAEKTRREGGQQNGESKREWKSEEIQWTMMHQRAKK